MILFRNNPNEAGVVMNEKKSKNFEPWMIMATWILREAGFKFFSFAKNIEDVQIENVKVGFNENKPTEIRHNNVPYGTAGLLWKTYGEKIFKGWSENERKDYILFKKIDEKVIQSFDREEYGVKNVCLSYCEVLKTFALTRNDVASGRDWKESFEDALEYLDIYMRNEIAHIESNTY